jgi:hypothetical protein
LVHLVRLATKEVKDLKVQLATKALKALKVLLELKD